MKKQILFLLALLPVALYAFDYEVGDIYYYINKEDKTAIVTSYYSVGNHSGFQHLRYRGDVVIPETIIVNGISYLVTTIGEEAFWGCDKLTSISIPKSIISIEKNAFLGCNDLSVYISDIAAWCNISFVWDGGYASMSNPLSKAKSLFLGNEIVEDLVIPSGISKIGFGAFYDFKGLKSLTIQNGLKTIEYAAFAGCSQLESVNIPNSVTSIEEGAFARTGILTITIPNNITTIKEATFYDCKSLGLINFSYGISDIEPLAFYGCSSITSITIGNSVTNIGSEAFAECSGLMSVTIPNSVNSIGSEAFNHCHQIAEVYCYAETVPSTDKSVFDHTSIEEATLYVPASAIGAYKEREPWNRFKIIEAITMPVIDFNEDGDMNVTDVVTLINCISKDDFTGINKEAADVNGDGEVNVTDVVTLILLIATAK